MDSKKHTSLSHEKAVISRTVGGSFTAWNGHITGFNLALRPGQKIVQAWRATGWWPDHYSIAIFDFKKGTTGAKLTFTQIGIPPHRYSGHYRGWIETYWTPMKEILRDGHVSDKTLARLAIDRKERINKRRFRRAISKKS
jgi:activator of HSP90 ATPase